MAINSTISFENFTVDPFRRVLKKNGEMVSLNSKTFDLLLVLIENAGEVVGKNELLDRVWENQFVEENNLTVHVAALRKVFGEKKGEHRFIITVPGRGYSFVAASESREIINTGKDQLSAANVSTDLSATGFSENETIIGREREIAEIKYQLLNKNSRLLVLTGAGGSGKTTLAKFAADELTSDFAGGVFFIELHSIRDSNLLISTITKNLGVEEQGGKSPFVCLKDFLTEKRILLVLDNFEQLASAAPLVEKLLDSLPHLKILITSRISLKIKNELETVVTPLAVPAMDADSSIEGLFRFSAIRLFIQRAKAVRPNFVLSEENAKIVAEICRKLDGLPLAVELAAARIKLLSLKEISARLENSLKLLSGGAKNLPERQRTMYGTIEWSYELLDEQEKLLFRRLAIFSGGFTVDAAETILDGEKIQTSNPKTETLDLLASLVDNNLLETKEQKDGTMRLRMLEVIREFAFERLRISGELEMLRKDHAHFFLSLSKEAEPHFLGERSIEWLEKLESEIDNLRTAIEYFFQTDSKTAVQIVAASRNFWVYHNHFSEGRKLLERALEQSSGESTELRFKLLYSLAVTCRAQGDYPTARKMYQQALDEGRKAGDQKQVALSSTGVGTILQLQDKPAEALQYFEEGLKVSRELQDEYSTAYSLLCYGITLGLDGKPTEARKYLEESLTLVRRFGGKEAISNNLNNLAAVAFDEGDFPAALEYFTEGLNLSVEVGNKVNVIDAINGFAAIAAEYSEYESAAKLAGAAKNLSESVNYRQEPGERRFCETYIAKIREALDEESFDDAFRQGQALGFTETIKLANEHLVKISTNGQRDEQTLEIVFEKHRYEHIVIEEEIPPIKSINK